MPASVEQGRPRKMSTPALARGAGRSALAVEGAATVRAAGPEFPTLFPTRRRSDPLHAAGPVAERDVGVPDPALLAVGGPPDTDLVHHRLAGPRLRAALDETTGSRTSAERSEASRALIRASSMAATVSFGA